MFEVQDLKYATLATVSRCGMVWFSEDVLTSEIIFEHYLACLRHVPLEEGEEDTVRTPSGKPGEKKTEEIISPTIQVQRDVANILQLHFSPDGMVIRALEHAATHLEHIMDFTRFRALNALFSMLNQSVRNILNYNHSMFCGFTRF
jgi:dynein heavy chain 1